MENLTFEKMVREKRHKLGYTQFMLAREIVKASGIDPRDDLMEVKNYEYKIWRWENSRVIPRADDFKLLCLSLKTDLNEMAKYL